MRLFSWCKPGMGIKRWFLLGAGGAACIGAGLLLIVNRRYISPADKLIPVALIISGCAVILSSIWLLTKAFLKIITGERLVISIDPEKLDLALDKKKSFLNGPRIVVIGGGTGLSTMLRGLKEYSSNLTAIVTVADDGGGSGVLRQDLGMLPPGDIRNCILALADTEPVMQQLLQYRFKEGMLKGQNFGNLFLAAMDGISTSFEEAVKKMSNVLAVTGRVLPVTLEDVKLCARLEDEYVICGESKIGKHNEFHRGKIDRVFLQPEEVRPLQDAVDAIIEADVIVFGPGSLYTSVIPNLLVNGICDSIKKSKAVKVYACNVMTQPGETEDYSVFNHISAIQSHTYKEIIDYCIANTAGIPPELERKYADDGARIVTVDSDNIEKAGLKLITGDFVSVKDGFIRHNSKKLAAVIVELAVETVLLKDGKRIIDYYYAKDRLKKLNANGGSSWNLENRTG